MHTALQELPRTVQLQYSRWPDENEGVCVEFRLVYYGALPPQSSGGGGSHLREKHEIRRQIHQQLRELWHRHVFLSRYAEPVLVTKEGESESAPIPRFDFLARNYTKFGYRFVPLINNEWGLACSLDIVFLRRDDVGNLVVDGGDIDNRIKVLFDALRVPQYNQEIESFPPAEDEDPFFCLLEDDRLITDVKVTTDRLLVPTAVNEKIKDVHLLIHVKTKVLDTSKGFRVFD